MKWKHKDRWSHGMCGSLKVASVHRDREGLWTALFHIGKPFQGFKDQEGGFLEAAYAIDWCEEQWSLFLTKSELIPPVS